MKNLSRCCCVSDIKERKFGGIDLLRFPSYCPRDHLPLYAPYYCRSGLVIGDGTGTGTCLFPWPPHQTVHSQNSFLFAYLFFSFLLFQFGKFFIFVSRQVFLFHKIFTFLSAFLQRTEMFLSTFGQLKSERQFNFV